MARIHRHCGTSVCNFCHGQRWSQLSIGNLLHTSKRCLRNDGCDAWRCHFWETLGCPNPGGVLVLAQLSIRTARSKCNFAFRQLTVTSYPKESASRFPLDRYNSPTAVHDPDRRSSVKSSNCETASLPMLEW